MKKITFIFGLVTLTTCLQAQNGLENIIVEKYYVSNEIDSIGSIGNLPVGSVTYRVYADMLPSYKFQAMFGNSDHDLKVATTTTFFNNEDRGATTANAIPNIQLKNNTVALDSWFSVGAAAAGQFGVLKTDDDGVANLLPIVSNTMLKNTDASAGIALNVQDGIMAGSPEAVTTIGFTTELDIFDATSQQGGQFSTNNAAISALSGATGPTLANRILLGQFTTDGVFSFELNLQIGTPTPGVSQTFVAKNPVGNDIVLPSLTYTSPSIIDTDPSSSLIQNEEESHFISISPNPATDVITIHILNAKESGDNSYIIRDIRGAIVSESSLGQLTSNFSKTIDMSSNPSGIYFMTLSIDGEKTVKKIIIE